MDPTSFNPDILVPITLLVLAFLGFRAWLLHRDRGRRQLQQTLRAAMEAGARLPEDVWTRLVRAADPRRTDLRRAIVFAAVAATTAVVGWLLPFQDPQGRQALLAVAVVPAAMALMHLAFWRFWYRG